MVKIILFGAGRKLKESLFYLKHSEVKVLAICDNDKKIWGRKIFNKKIISPAEIKKYDFDIVIISNINYQEQIKKQLYEMGITTVLPIFAKTFTKKEKKIYDDVLNKYGKMNLAINRYKWKQDFFPSWLGIWVNPYYFSRKELAKYIKKYSGYVNGKCMDFGCGTKPYESLFKVKEYIGVEIETDRKKDDIVYYDGKTIPFSDEYFDSIVAFQVFEHIPNLDEIVKELNRVLKVGGYMFITVPFVYPEHLKPFDYRRFTSYGIKKYMEENEFEVVCYEKSGNFIETVCQMENVYINEEMFGTCGKFISKMLCFFTNLKGVCYTKIKKNSKELYLDNVILVKKISSNRNKIVKNV